MNNIDPSVRSSFFPSSKTGKSDKASSLKQASLKRNDSVRKNELEAFSKADAKVEINDAIKDFARIKKVADAAPERDNSAKIAKLKAQIQEGNYKVDYDALADRILESEF